VIERDSAEHFIFEGRQMGRIGRRMVRTCADPPEIMRFDALVTQPVHDVLVDARQPRNELPRILAEAASLFDDSRKFVSCLLA
jgi:hypothetical protein